MKNYSHLADEPEPIADACRRAQLFLRENNVDDVLEYAKSRPRIKEKTKLALIADIDRFAAANTAKGLYRGATYLFSRFMYWGSFCISGVGRSVCPPDIADVHGQEGDESNITIEGDKIRFNATEALLEVEVLKREGKMRQAEAMLSLARLIS